MDISLQMISYGSGLNKLVGYNSGYSFMQAISLHTILFGVLRMQYISIRSL